MATVLFIDIVDSTRVAALVGDRQWRELLSRFRQVVRKQLKKHGGREEDTAGDGFFATFDRPADALTAAASVATEVQALGLNVRAAAHTGELERIDRRSGGIAAHIGARVLAAAGPGELLVTATVRDLVVGGGMTFEPAGDTELKGVPGVWSLHRVVAVDGRTLAPPINRDEAARRVSEVSAATGRRVGWAFVMVAVLVLLAGVAFAGVVLFPSQPTALVRLDPGSREVLQTVHDEHVSLDAVASIWAADGNLWQTDLQSVTRRDLGTGGYVTSFELPDPSLNVITAFGSVWVAHGLPGTVIDRLDPISGRRLARIDPGADVWDVAAGDDAVWVLLQGAEIVEIDPISGGIVDRDATDTATEPVYLRYTNGQLLLCECPVGRIATFDPTQDAVVDVVEYPQRGFGAVDPETGVIWVQDREASTLTPYLPDSDLIGRSIGLDGPLGEYAFGFGALWVAAGDHVHRVDSRSFRVDSVPMPDGVFAASIAIDEEAALLWVSSCVCTEQH